MTITEMIEELFWNKEETEELLSMKAEITENCAERYKDLLAEGKTEEEALLAVRESLFGVEEILHAFSDKQDALRNIDVNLTSASVYITMSDVREIKIVNEDTQEPYLLKRLRRVFSNSNGSNTQEREIGSYAQRTKDTLRITSFCREEPSRMEIYLPKGKYDTCKIHCVSGDIFYDKAIFDTVELKTTSGEITCIQCAESTGKNVTIDTNSGDVTADFHGESASCHTVSGDICCTVSTKELTVETISGDITLHPDEAVETIRARSASGDITIEFQTKPREIRGRVQSQSGDVHNAFPVTQNPDAVMVEAVSMSGDIRVS